MSDTERPAVADDPQDPLRPEVEDENSAPTPPLADPHQDTEVVEEQPDATADPLADDDDESVLSEIDEAQFEDFDPAAIAIEERPIPVDESNVNSIGKYKRKRAEGEEPKKKKKSKKKRSSRGDDDTFEGGEEVEGRRTKKRKDVGDGTRVRSHAPARQSPDNLDHLTPEERRKRALDKKMDNALRNPNRGRTRKKDEIVCLELSLLMAVVLSADFEHRIWKPQRMSISIKCDAEWQKQRMPTSCPVMKGNLQWRSSRCCQRSSQYSIETIFEARLSIPKVAC